jgi:ubiquinone biosynthesis protein
MDFIHESINVQRFYNHLKADTSRDQYALAPMVYQQYTTERVLALEFINGIKIDKVDKLREKGHDIKVIAHRLLKSYFKQIFEYGFFHADPHPGNLLVMPNSHICYLDFGMMGSMMPRDIETFGQLFLSISRREVRKLIRVLLQLSVENPVINMRELEYDISEFVEKYYVRDIHQNEMSTVMLELKDIIVEHGLKVPTYFYLFARSLVTIEGVVEKLDPELEQFEMVKPFLAESIRRRYDPIKIGRSMVNSLLEINKYMEEFPQDLKNAIRKIESGQVKVELSHKGIDPIVHTVQRIAKQLVSAFVMTALIVGATLFIIYDVAPIWKGISVIGLVCTVVAGIIAIGMLWNISKGDYDY